MRLVYDKRLLAGISKITLLISILFFYDSIYAQESSNLYKLKIENNTCNIEKFNLLKEVFENYGYLIFGSDSTYFSDKPLDIVQDSKNKSIHFESIQNIVCFTVGEDDKYFVVLDEKKCIKSNDIFRVNDSVLFYYKNKLFYLENYPGTFPDTDSYTLCQYNLGNKKHDRLITAKSHYKLLPFYENLLLYSYEGWMIDLSSENFQKLDKYPELNPVITINPKYHCFEIIQKINNDRKEVVIAPWTINSNYKIINEIVNQDECNITLTIDDKVVDSNKVTTLNSWFATYLVEGNCYARIYGSLSPQYNSYDFKITRRKFFINFNIYTDNSGDNSYYLERYY